MVFLVGPNREEAMKVLYPSPYPVVPSSRSFYQQPPPVDPSRSPQTVLYHRTCSGKSNNKKDTESILDLTASTTATAEDYDDDDYSHEGHEHDDDADAYVIREVPLSSPSRNKTKQQSRRPPLSSLFQTDKDKDKDKYTQDTLPPPSPSSSRLAHLRAKVAAQRRSHHQQRTKTTTPPSSHVVGAAATKPLTLPFTPLGLECLIKSLRSTDDVDTVVASLLRLHAEVQQQQQQQQHADRDDRTFEVTFWRKGGHLGVLEAMRNYPRTGAVQAMGSHLLTWLCQRCGVVGVKRELVSRGTVRLVRAALMEFSHSKSPWVRCQALRLLGQLSALRKVAESLARGSDLRDLLLTSSGSGNGSSSSSGGDDGRNKCTNPAMDATLFVLQTLARHQSARIAGRCLRQDAVPWVVRHMRLAYKALSRCDATPPPQPADDDARRVAECETTLLTGCVILRDWAKAVRGTDDDDDEFTDKTVVTLVSDLLLTDSGLTETIQQAAQDCQVALTRAADRKSRARKFWVW